MISHLSLRFAKMTLLLALFVALLLPSAVFALDETGTPRFAGTTLTIHDQTFVWDQATSNESTNWRYDFYYSTTDGSTLEVVGPLYNSNLATANGNGISGYIQYGYYNDLVQMGTPSPIDVTYNGTHYTTSTLVTYYTVNTNADEMTLTSQIGQMYSASDRSFTAVWDNYGIGTIFGSESGLVYGATPYVNESSSSDGTFTKNGVQYNHLTTNSTYVWNFYNQPVVNLNEYYTNADGGWFSHSVDGVYGDISDESYTPKSPSEPSFSLFGSDYYINQSYWVDNCYGGPGLSEVIATRDHYISSTGGYLDIFHSEGEYGDVDSINGWDPYAGSFSSPSSSDFNDIAADPRTSPAFAASQLWVNGTLVNWQSGAITLDGIVTDNYIGGTSGDIAVTISGSVADYYLGTSTPDVTINGSNVGTYSLAGQFNTSGWDVQSGAPNRTSPFFSANQLWVDGSPYSFSYGYQDYSGNRTDVYAASGGMVSIAGNTSTATTATVWVNHNGDIHTGTVTFAAGGSFEVSGVDIEVIAPGSVPAFWVGNEFYLRNSGSTNSYTSFPTGGHTLEVGGSEITSLTVTLTNAAGTSTGSFNASAGGVFLMEHEGVQTAACAANADGTLVPSGTAAAGYPPAVQMLGSIWNYLGEAADDEISGSTAAYYGNTRTAVYSTDPEAPSYGTPLINAAQRLLKIRVESADAVAVALRDYSGASVNTVGSYRPVAHLFQVASGEANPLTMPVFAVDPQNSDILWILHPTEAENLPASFIVHGQAWRYAGTTGGTATYLGSYSGQQMALGAADDQGQRLVTVVDPVYNNGSSTPTEGTLSSVRQSVQLRDGSTVFSGNDAGAQVAVSHVDNDKLQTVAADLDIVGNNLSFGIMQGDASLAGSLFQFADQLRTNEDSSTTLVASLSSILSRPQAQWVWARRASTSGQATLSVMQLDDAHKLKLYDPAGSGQTGVVLDPKPDGISAIKGVLLVRPGGDVSMGEFTAGGTP